MPVAYHGRASSVRVSGTPVRRPRGPAQSARTRRRRATVHRAISISSSSSASTSARRAALGETVPIGQAAEHIFGFCLLNDWSARDIQAWEYQPLGPFLGKNFATTVSPWVVTQEALAPFRAAAFARPAGDPAPLPYLDDAEDRAHGGLDITLEAYLATEAMRRAGHGAAAAHASTSFADDLLDRGADGGAPHLQRLQSRGRRSHRLRHRVRRRRRTSWGSLLELTARGREPIALPTGEKRGFIEDGDEIIFKGFCSKQNYPRIGFGECRAVLLPAS